MFQKLFLFLVAILFVAGCSDNFDRDEVLGKDSGDTADSVADFDVADSGDFDSGYVDDDVVFDNNDTTADIDDNSDTGNTADTGNTVDSGDTADSGDSGTVVYIIGDACYGCGRCPSRCPEGAITMVGRKAIIDPAKCTGCGDCVSSCPVNAIHKDE
ncbi:4Fe-4S binding protein [bacterium]|nr:4Fe-4S binding protein [bacterium]